MSTIEAKRHSLAHILAYAAKELYPETKLGMGPAIENGFYYDFNFGEIKIGAEDLPRFEEEMRRLLEMDIKFEKKEISKEEAKEFFRHQPLKLEIIKDLPDENISIYESGKFTDLCKGPHVKNSKEITPRSFKLLKIAGAYWKGSEKNQMLTRIYGLAFETEKELAEYQKMLQEAEKRDHRKIGKEMDLFVFSDLVGPGLPLYTPKGVVIKEELQKEVESICRKYGFEKVSAPSLAKPELFEISGHAKKFGDELFKVTSEKKHYFTLKPVQCPHQTQIYASRTRSYKELPIRYMESDKQYRAEKSGEVGGLSRVYAITVEDGHSFCQANQVKEEIKNMVSIIKDFYSKLGLWENHWVSLSVRDYTHPEKYIGESADWDTCERILQEISDEMKLDAKKREGEAALYGPKLDFMFKDATGREIQIPTVQIDFATPKRFNLEYINEKGEKTVPVMVHRAILGSYERFLVLLIEHFAGHFPLWLAPEQVRILPVSEKFNSFGQKIAKELRSNMANLRIWADDSNESLGKKIRSGEMAKVPYLLIIGEKEKKANSLSVRFRGKDLGSMKPKKFIDRLEKEISSRK